MGPRALRVVRTGREVRIGPGARELFPHGEKENPGDDQNLPRISRVSSCAFSCLEGVSVNVGLPKLSLAACLLIGSKYPGVNISLH